MSPGESKVELSRDVLTRCGFSISRAKFLTSTASQGLTFRRGTIIDSARGSAQMDDDNWWLHLCMMFSRVTSFKDLLLLRLPEREFLEQGPPASIQARLRKFHLPGRGLSGVVLGMPLNTCVLLQLLTLD